MIFHILSKINTIKSNHRFNHKSNHEFNPYPSILMRYHKINLNFTFFYYLCVFHFICILISFSVLSLLYHPFLLPCFWKCYNTHLQQWITHDFPSPVCFFLFSFKFHDFPSPVCFFLFSFKFLSFSFFFFFFVPSLYLSLLTFICPFSWIFPCHLSNHINFNYYLSCNILSPLTCDISYFIENKYH